jgi:hypothetical protein
MTPTLRLSLLPVLAVVWLTATPCRAQFPEASPNGLHTVSLNLTPSLNREVQLSYERALFKTSSLEVTVGTRIPSAKDRYVQTVSLFSSFYENRLFALPYEQSYAVGVHWKKFFHPNRVFSTFISPGVLYRYSFFDDKTYGEESRTRGGLFSFSSIRQFSLRKHEATVRVLFGIRRQFYLSDGRRLLTVEASYGVGGGKRFGRFLHYQELGVLRETPAAGNFPNVHFNVGVFTLPINLKIGYSWGG